MRIKPTVVVSSSGNSPPLIKPCRRFSRTRLSMAVHRTRCRDRPLCGATLLPLKRANLCCRCYLPGGSHRTCLRFAVHVDQVRSLHSSPVTGLRRYYEPLRLLPRPNGPRGSPLVPAVGSSPSPPEDLILSRPPFRTFHPADRRSDWTTYRSASPVLHRVCFRPVGSLRRLPGGSALRCLRFQGSFDGVDLRCGLLVQLGCSPPVLTDTQLPRLSLETTNWRMRLALMVGWFRDRAAVALISRIKPENLRLSAPSALSRSSCPIPWLRRPVCYYWFGSFIFAIWPIHFQAINHGFHGSSRTLSVVVPSVVESAFSPSVAAATLKVSGLRRS